MKTLFLLRHAKSIPSEPGGSDFDRTLTEQGSRDAEMVGQYLGGRQRKIDLVISSPAKRARETTELVLHAAQLAVDVRYDRRIYDATSQDLLAVISEFDPQLESIMVVGHNPSMEDLLRSLTTRKESMSAAALAEIDIEGDGWNNEIAGNCALKRIVTARDCCS
jgi:phosphohistidine phosphatase